MQTSMVSRAQIVRTPGLSSVLLHSRAFQAHVTLKARPVRARNVQHIHQRSNRNSCTVCAAATDNATFYDFAVKDIDGRNVNMSKYKGKVVLAVNVASQCGFTKQYTQLAELYTKYQKQGLVILGFPCNQFNNQEPGDNMQIKKFAKSRGAEFPLMNKIKVNGPRQEPLYGYLKEQQSGIMGSDVKWNFTKFLVGKNGDVVKRYGSITTPVSIESDIVAQLNA